MNFWQRTKDAYAAIHDAILANRTLDVAFIFLWFFYAGFGILTIAQNASVFHRAGSPEFFQTIWGGGLGVASLVALAAAVTSFYLPHSRYDLRIRGKRVERFAIFVLLGLLALYPVLLAAYGGGEGSRPDLLSLSGSYFVFPVWRVIHLKARINQLYHVAEVKRQEGL